MAREPLMARAAWFFPVPDEGALPERLRSLFAKARERIGFGAPTASSRTAMP